MLRLTLCLLLISIFLQTHRAARAINAVTVKTQMNVKEADPKKTHFMQVGVNKDGKPVGIIVKRRRGTKKSMKQRKPKQISDEIQEIVGVRVPDDAGDQIYVFRNAKIVNNTLVMKQAAFS